ncbi:MAG: hypothetical protein HPY85_06890 [Anaerolineae bacterium]|nr:hypothetical protein [Anaerolineae bacterium]
MGMKWDDDVVIEGQFRVYGVKPWGPWQTGKLVAESQNLVVDDGIEFILDRMIGDESGSLAFLAIGTGNTAAANGQSTLATETERKAFSSQSRSGYAIECRAFFPADDCSIEIEEVGIFGGSSASESADSGKLVSRALLNYDNSSGEYDLLFVWTFTIGRA